MDNQWNEWHLTLFSPWGWTGRALAALAALLVLVLAWRALRREVAWRRLVLLSLRALGLLCALVLFFQPAVQLRNVTKVPNHIAVLLDTSESMNLAEQSGDRPRIARQSELLQRQGAALAALRQQHVLDFYTFGDRLLPATEDVITRPPPARADATRAREALAALRMRYEGRDLAGVVVLSDGLDNGRLREGYGKGGGEAALDGDTSDFLRALDAPVHTIDISKPGLQDVAVAVVMADEFAFTRTPVSVEARLLISGAEAAGWLGRHLPVTLRRDGAPVLTVDIEVQAGQREYRVVFPFTPERVGKYIYEVGTPPLRGESITENNRRLFVLKVIRDKIRVVHVAGRPSWDVRFLRGLFKHDPNIDLVSFFILRSPSDIDLGSSETSLIPFPCEELFQQQLRSFDLVVLHNFNYYAYCAQYLLPAIVPFVQDGGAVAMVGGDLSFSSGGYYGSELTQVLPIDLLPPGLSTPQGGKDPLIDAEPFRPQLGPEGRSHVVTALQLDVRKNEARWAQLPPLVGLNLVAKLRSGGAALLTHPQRRGEDGKPLPVLAVGEYGKGRSLTLMADSTWRWGFGNAAADGKSEGDARATAYQRLWEQAVRWLIRDPSLRLLRVESSESEYGREQPVRLSLKALSPDYRPAPKVEISVHLQRITDDGGSLTRSARTGEDGEAHLELEGLKAGGYRVTARATLGGRPVEETEVFLVRGASRELDNLEGDFALLQAISAATSGEARRAERGLSGLRFHPPHVVRINNHRDVELWDNAWVLLLATLCLGLNWTLRRRWGYA